MPTRKYAKCQRRDSMSAAGPAPARLRDVTAATETTATPDPRAVWESLTPALRNDLGCVVANGGGKDDLPLATANPLAAAGLVRHVGRLFRVGKAWWIRCNATDLGRAVAAVGA